MDFNFNFDPKTLPRELLPHYISASDSDIKAMLNELNLSSPADLFSHLDPALLFDSFNTLPPALKYEEVAQTITDISNKNNNPLSFIGDALPVNKTPTITPHIAAIRNLTTSYTAYQPERSQGTLISHWIYQCLMAQLTGFEAINASLYDRSTAIFEAINCSIRISKHKDPCVILSQGLFPQDIEVIQTLALNTPLKLIFTPLDPATGLLDIGALEKILETQKSTAAIIFPQINHLGLIEDPHTITNLAHKHQALATAVVDPLLLAQNALIPPSDYGDHGADIIVGEAQHLAIGPNFGGPGLGFFGVRFNENNSKHIRSAPGRFVGKTQDIHGNNAFAMVLSTREQHIRKDKATSNICSNQAFLATLAGAALLELGDQGLTQAASSAQSLAHSFAKEITQSTPITLLFPNSPFFNEVTLQLPSDINDFLNSAYSQNIAPGIDISSRTNSPNCLKVSFNNTLTQDNLNSLINLFQSHFGKSQNTTQIPSIPQSLIRSTPTNIPQLPTTTITAYYQQLGDLNIGPENTCYPLGSCTMKYNPYINDWAANLDNFTQTHPQTPLQFCQGSLEVLYHIQEQFKAITGLPAVTTQPVAGAQGELVGIKLFQAYHKHNNQPQRRKILIPKSAHGTNFATAIMAGLNSCDIIPLDANPQGQVDLQQLDSIIQEHPDQICGIMITNPNTCGIFESNFKQISDKIHSAGGLVYMDGANMNAIAGWVNINNLGVDALHNNLHKTWSIPHGGGGPGDAIVAVSDKLKNFLPGLQITKNSDNSFSTTKPPHSIGSFHRHWGNFAHKVRALTYLLRLGSNGIQAMSSTAVLSAGYLFKILNPHFPTLPSNTESIPRMHEFILTLSDQLFNQLQTANFSKNAAIPRLGKLFLDYGYHAPTVAFPEPLGLMIEPTETYSKAELDDLANTIIQMKSDIQNNPSILENTPTSMPIARVDEVHANRNLTLSEPLSSLPPIPSLQNA